MLFLRCNMISLARGFGFLAGFGLLLCASACAGGARSTPPAPTAQPTEQPAPAQEAVDTQNAQGPRKVLVSTPVVLEPAGATPPRPEFDAFVAQVKNGEADQIVGVYVENVLSLRVVQQPAEDPNYVSNLKGVVTQFTMAYEVAGNIGLLAHNYLSGALFFDIKTGNVAQLIYGDGSVEEFEVTDYHEYQALNPESPTSDFLDLTTGEKLSASDLFNIVYTGERRLVFQTCVSQDNSDTWGRLFVMSFPY